MDNMPVQLSIAPVQVDNQWKIVVGWSNEAFSQAVYLPLQDDISALADGIAQAIKDAAKYAKREQSGLVVTGAVLPKK